MYSGIVAEQRTLVIDIYARISKAKDGRTISVQEQDEDCRAAIEEHDRDGWVVGMSFLDHALSGWSPKVRRPEWEALMERLESGKSDGVMVYDLTRFTRKPIEGERLIAVAERGLIVSSLENTYNLADPDSRAHFRTDMTQAAKESDKNSQRTTRGKAKKARRGRSNAGPRGYAMEGPEPRPEGWEQGDPRPPMVALEIVNAERAIVQEAARRHLGGDTIDEIVRDYNRRGLKSLSGPWTSNTMRQLLKRPSLAGLVVYKGQIVEGKTLPGEPVLDRETWDRLQTLFASRKRGRLATTYLLSGLMHCAECYRASGGQRLQRMYGRPRPARTPYPDGEVARDYFCQPQAYGGGCGRVNIDQRLADEIVRRAVILRLSDPRFNDGISRRAADARAEREPLDARLAELQTQEQDLLSKAGSDTWTPDRMERYLAGLDAQKAKIIEKLKALQASSEMEASPIEDAQRTWDAAQASGDLTAMRSMVRWAFPRLMLLRAGGGPAQQRFIWDAATSEPGEQ
jgi:DNA invertase Pin-like site-specific DNA recombinase